MPTVGTCSNCGGPVQTPDMWGSVIPPTPTCARCGAVAAAPFGPVIQMVPVPGRSLWVNGRKVTPSDGWPDTDAERASATTSPNYN